MRQALEQAKAGQLHILSRMAESPRGAENQYVGIRPAYLSR